MNGSLRARGALYGLAIGDALGMPTQMLSRAQIRERWGGLLRGFEPAPAGHPIAAGLPAGAITDDTEQAVLLGRLLVKGHGTVDPRELAEALVGWERDMAARGSLDLLGPSTKRAVAAVMAGTPPEQAGAFGDTNGAAMRIAPVGIAVAVDLSDSSRVDASLSALVDQVAAVSRVTHGTSVALAGAAAVAAAVSAGISGAGIAEATALAVQAARIAAGRGRWVAGADVAARIEWAADLVAGPDSAGPGGRPPQTPPQPGGPIPPDPLWEGRPPQTPPQPGGPIPPDPPWEGRPPQTPPSRHQAAELIYTLVGTSLAAQESVPAAFAVLAAVPGDAWQACLLAASLGGDGDTIAAMAGAVAGACQGIAAFPPEAVAVIDAHGLGLAGLADDLYALRMRPRDPPDAPR